MRRLNLLDADRAGASERAGYRWRATRVGERLGAERIGGSIYELDAGERTFPYHFHHGVEEWLLVVDGAPSLRTLDGERTLAPGECVCFPSGPAGAHALTGPGASSSSRPVGRRRSRSTRTATSSARARRARRRTG